LKVEALESVIGVGVAGIAFVDAAQEPAHLRAAARPFDEGFHAGGPRQIASVAAMMNHQRARQHGRRAEDRSTLLDAGPDSGLRMPEVRTNASGLAPRAIPSAARGVPALVATTSL
jgi:hypothetical protein